MYELYVNKTDPHNTILIIHAGSQSLTESVYNNRELNKIEYNFLHLPSQVQHSYGHTVKYTYDPAIGRFFTMDPLAEKYYNISPYAYVANNPLRYIDPTGMWIVGTDGRAVAYSRKNGWSENAPRDVQRLGNAMMKTETGKSRLKYMIEYNEKISISMSSSVVGKEPEYIFDNYSSIGPNKRNRYTLG
ncbi:hypothetical protein AwDysgo_01430 [Bacteroidales bacterium]|nr:hypothetical protein AwDysgo_01430 [Bacteroidales bacterium]